MGVLRLTGTILRHPAINGALMENTPIFECLLVDYNANIHYITTRVITELNEIMYFTYQREQNVKSMLMPKNLFDIPIEYNFDLGLTMDDIEILVEKYNEDYCIGITYEKINTSLTDEKISDIIFYETIKYTKMLICSINKGWIKKIYLALDGTPSMAKINEQRNRRYISLHINNIKEDIVKKYKFHDSNIRQIDIFHYRSMICVGTKLMDRIQQALFHLDIGIDTDVSTVNIRGEGEKKIIYAIEEYLHYESFCIMSPDSDMLILIGMLGHDEKFHDKKIYNFRIDYQNKNQYQFFDLRQLVSNLKNYYSLKLGCDIPQNKMLDLFFMLVVFGNDFLPKLEPLDITKHFDLVCEIALKISVNGKNFIENNELNYDYILDFFRVIENKTLEMSIESCINSKYNNYQKLCRQMSIDKTDLDMNMHHPLLKPITVSYNNFTEQMKILTNAYSKFINFMKTVYITKHQIMDLYRDMHSDVNDSYFLLVAPRFIKYPNMVISQNPQEFFMDLVKYITGTKKYTDIKFRIRLMPKEYKKYNPPNANINSYLQEIEKLNHGLEPYRSIFRVEDIKLVDYDLANNRLTDLRDKYYETYVDANIKQENIDGLVLDYLLGIEWLFQYYIKGEHLELSSWFYNSTRAPLISSIIKYLEATPNISKKLQQKLAEYPENDLSLLQHYLYVTPNEYTNANIAPNLSDVLHLIDGYGAAYLNKCQIKWHEYHK